MTETIETADETVEDVDESVDESTTEEAEAAEDNSQESDAAEEGATEDEEDPEDEDDVEPPTRKPRTNADWVALRRQQKLDKQKAGNGEQGEDEDEDLEDDEDDVSDEDAKLIDKRIDQRLNAEREKAAITSEIDEFATSNPDFKPFVARAKAWAKHPTWKDVPTKQLMHAAAGDKLMMIGAKRAKAAIAKANKTKTGTHSGGEAGGAKPVAAMSDAEFEQEIQRVKNSPRN